MNIRNYLGTAVIILLLFFNGSIQTIAQEQSENRRSESLMVREWFEEISLKTDFRFFYNDDLEGLDEVIELEARLREIDLVLDELTEKTSFEFKKLNDNLIAVVPTINQQSIVVSGTVKSSRDNYPLPGVNIYTKGSTRGTVTDGSGSYSLEVGNKYDVLVFSFIGFENQEIPINGKTQINVSLKEDAAALEEVVVTALNISRDKSSLGYSVTQVGSEAINTAKENNPINSLAGKVAGLQITRSPTGVDGSSRVVLRGIASILGGNRPLFVIDGIPMDAGHGGAGRWGGRDGGDALSDLNPDDIESMSVLKGAGASALYGSRGANGVIIITTKKGTSRKGIGISFTSNFSIEDPMVLPDFQNEYGNGAFGQYPPLNGPTGPNNDYPWIWSFGPKMDGQLVTNWYGEEEALLPQANQLAEFLRTGTSLTNTLAFEGGDENTTFRASVTNQNSNGLMPNNDLMRRSINLRGSSKLGKNIVFDGKISYINSVVNNRPSLAEDGANIIQSLSILPRNISLNSLKENILDVNGNEFKWTADNTFCNPYWILEHTSNQDEKHRLQTMFSMNWNMAKDLSFMIRSGFDFRNSRGLSIEDPGRILYSQGLGSKSQSLGNGIEWNTDALLSYTKSISDDWKINLNVGGNYRKDEGRGMNQGGSNMKIPDFYYLSNYASYWTGEWYSQKEVFSLFGMSQLSYKNYVYLDLTYRNDWSSTLPLQNNSYGYHSENLSFLFTEAFGIRNNILRSGKIRASYAKVGNDTGAYQVEKYYSVYQTQYSYPMGGIGGTLPFFDLAPEETQSYEVGADIQLFNFRRGLSRVTIDFTYYYSLSDKQIMNVDLAPSTGFGSKRMNAGEIENKGLELQLNAHLLESNSGDFKWDAIFIWTKNKNTVKELYGDMAFLPLGEEFHAAIQAHVDRPYGEIYTNDFKRNTFGDKLIDDNGYAIQGEWKAMGNINPDWMAGLTNRISYKNLSMSFLIDMQMGGDVYSWGKSYKGLFGTGVETLPGRAEWIAGTGGYIEEGINENTGKPNDVAIDPTQRWYHLFNKEIGTEWMQKATNLRLREFILSYRPPSIWMEKIPFNSIDISLVGRNLFFFYRAMEHVDPEASFASGSVSTGIEHLSLPSTRSFGVNLSLNF